ncbi:MAG: roadblock/LC7 domain-containing protein [Thermoanaerobaculaceae bacterium]|nr:roadblock/LC7 domain-containing protein [Thermoanaerobaculaceae bacterium]TAM50966.1 MAG: roadblock/LC7 domain-containing protein [Acidobacteriota bacterium]
MTFEDALTGVRECAGVSVTVISDRDGIPVTSWSERSEDVEELIAEYSTFLRDVTSANRELQLGALDQVAVVAERKVVLITSITDTYFLLAVVGRDGNPGKARFASRLAAHRLRHEFV